MNPKLLTIRDVMQIFSISRRTVHYWIKDGTLPTVRINGLCRFHPEDIDDLIERHRGQVSKKKHILAVDDDFLVRESLKAILRKAGWDATVVASGEEAIKCIEKQNFDLVLTDIRMPDTDGIEVLKRIRKARGLKGKKPAQEIILTAYDDKSVRDEAEKMGVSRFMLKPFDVDEFLDVVRQNLN